METNLQQAGASDSWGKAACTPGLALWRRGGTAGEPRSALPQLPAAAAAGGGKVVGDGGAAGVGAEEEENPAAQRRFARREESAGASPSK